MESLAQMGVQLLLFALGLEFSLSKLRAVRAVALLGELWEINIPGIIIKAVGKFLLEEQCSFTRRNKVKPILKALKSLTSESRASDYKAPKTVRKQVQAKLRSLPV